MDIHKIFSHLLSGLPEEVRDELVELLSRLIKDSSGLMSIVPAKYRRVATYVGFLASMVLSCTTGVMLSPTPEPEVPVEVVQKLEAATAAVEAAAAAASKRRKLVGTNANGDVVFEAEF